MDWTLQEVYVPYMLWVPTQYVFNIEKRIKTILANPLSLEHVTRLFYSVSNALQAPLINSVTQNLFNYITTSTVRINNKKMLAYLHMKSKKKQTKKQTLHIKLTNGWSFFLKYSIHFYKHTAFLGSIKRSYVLNLQDSTFHRKVSLQLEVIKASDISVHKQSLTRISAIQHY